MINASKRHLAQNQISYVQHLKFAFWAGGLLLWAGFTSIKHSSVHQFFQYFPTGFCKYMYKY